MAVVDLVPARLALVALHIHAVLLGVEPELAVVEAHAAAGQAAGALVNVVLVAEAGGDLLEVAAAPVDLEGADLVPRALRDLAELGLAGLGPELLLDREGSCSSGSPVR